MFDGHPGPSKSMSHFIIVWQQQKGNVIGIGFRMLVNGQTDNRLKYFCIHNERHPATGRIFYYFILFIYKPYLNFKQNNVLGIF